MEESNDDEKSIVAQWKEYFNRLDEYTKNGSIDRVEDIKLERDILRTALLNIVTKNAEKGQEEEQWKVSEPFQSQINYKVARKLLQEIKSQLVKHGMEEPNMKESIIKDIENFLNIPFREQCNGDDEFCLTDDVYSGWKKNQHELRKRKKKMEKFSITSEKKLNDIEKEIRKSQENNQIFRHSLDAASDKISVLIQQLQDANMQSEFLQKQINVVDETVSEMEKCKRRTEQECAQLQEELFEKQESLVRVLKRIDKELETNLLKHQDYLEKNEHFNEALEEIASCYSTFEEQEIAILSKYGISKPNPDIEIDSTVLSNRINMDLNQKVETLKKEHRRMSIENEALVIQKDTLTVDVDDLFHLNQKLSEENMYLQSQLDVVEIDEYIARDDNPRKARIVRFQDEGKISDSDEEKMEITKGKIVHVKDSSDDKKNKEEKDSFEKISTLETKVEELSKRNEHLATINIKVQEIYDENKELLEENNNLNDEIENLEEKLKAHQKKENEKEKHHEEQVQKMKQYKEENDELKEGILHLKEAYHPKLLYVRAKNIDILKLENNNNANESEELLLEKALIDEKDRSTELERSNQSLQNINKTLTGLAKRVGLDNLQLNQTYRINIQSGDEYQVMSFSGICVSEKEKEAMKIRSGNLGDVYSVSTWREEENIVEELSKMLHESYKQCDQMKEKQRAMKDNVEQMAREINVFKATGNAGVTGDILLTTKNNDNEPLQILCSLLTDLGIQKLENGVLYTVHFQAMSKTATTRKASKAYQHSCNPTTFDVAKRIINNVAASALSRDKVLPKRTPNDDFSLKSLDISLQEILSHDDAALTTDSKDDLERLLRISKRETEEMKRKIRQLQNELSHLKECRKEFAKEKKFSEEISDEEEKEENEVTRKKKEDITEIIDLEQAYKLSEANCVFLERKYREVEQELKNVKSCIDQQREDSFDKSEQIDCLKQELVDVRAKHLKNTKLVSELKKDLEYLERDVEFYKQKLIENNIELISDPSTIISSGDNYSKANDILVLKADLEMATRDKHSVSQECESLKTQIKYLQIEKRYLEKQVKNQVQREGNELKKTGEVLDITENRERTAISLESEVKEHGLAKKYRRTEKENHQLRQEIQDTKTDKVRIDKKLKLQLIETEALKSNSDNLQSKMLELEKIISELQPKKTGKQRKVSTSAKEFAVKFAIIEEQSKGFENGDNLYRECEVIKEEAILLAHENEEIKESNDVLVKRNSNLRRESLAANSAKIQVELLKEQISSLENENEILKVESMRANLYDNERKSGFLKKVSQELNIPLETHALRKLSCVVLTKATQTEVEIKDTLQTRSYSVDESDNEIVIEELQFVIEDLTKRNSELKTKLYGLEKKLEDLEKENVNLEDINNRLLDRNDALKKQVEDNKQNGEVATCDSADTDDPSLGINLFFKNDILGEYEKAELEEENKALKYENRMLKENTNENEKLINNLKSERKELLDNNGALMSGNNELISILQDLKGEDFTNELLADLRIQRDPDWQNNKCQNHSSDHTGDNIVLKIDSPLHEEGASTDELKKQLDKLAQRNSEYKSTIDHLERQLLQLTHHSQNNEDVDKNETVDELFAVKFLLESNPVARSENLLEKESDSDDFTSCIQEGELASEMEDFFKNYSTGDLDDTDIESDIEEEDMDNMESEPPLLYKADDEPAKKIGQVSRFRAKEHIEKALDVCQQQLSECKQRNKMLYDEIDDLKTKYHKCNSEKEVSEKALIALQKNFTECAATAEEQNKEIELLKQEINQLRLKETELLKDVSKAEEKITELQLLSKGMEDDQKEYKQKTKRSEVEIENLKRVIEEQEHLMHQLELNQSKADEVEDIQSKYELLKKEHKETLEELNEMISQYKECENEVEEQKEQIMQKEEDVRELMTILKEKEVKCEQLNKENEELQEDVKERQQSLKKLEEFLLNENKALSAVQKKCEVLEQENKRKEDTIHLLKKDSNRQEKKEIDVVAIDKQEDKPEDISFEIKASSDDSKQAIEMSLEEADMTLPEVCISKESSSSVECQHCFRRSLSFPSAKPNTFLNYPRNNLLGLSDVSDVESIHDGSESYNEDYVFKLKTKLKLSREKIREKNKVIRNQNVDIDNFLEDIGTKEKFIEKLRKEIEEIKKTDEKEKEVNKEEGIIELETPSFLEKSLTTQPSETEMIKGEENVISELFTFTEQCCKEIDELRAYVNTLEMKANQKPDLNKRLEDAMRCINKLKRKIQTCVDLKLISCSESIDDVVYADPTDRGLSTPDILDASIALDRPGKTVNEIRSDNEKLKEQNVELKNQLKSLESRLSEIINEQQDEKVNEGVANDNERVRYTGDKESTLKFLRADSGCDTDRSTEDGVASAKIEKLKQKLQTTESQIEKDWEIIESQGYQLENLHQQYIEQRDENRMNSENLDKTKKDLKNKEKRITSLLEEIKEIETSSKSKEEELEKLLEEKEDGIEKLHLMISELEKSLTNSQSHIEGILNDSFESRDREKDHVYQINDKESMIEDLKVELTKVKEELETLKLGMDAMPTKVLDFTTEEDLLSLRDKVDALSFHHKTLNKDTRYFIDIFKNQFIGDIEHLRHLMKEIFTREQISSKIDNNMSVAGKIFDNGVHFGEASFSEKKDGRVSNEMNAENNTINSQEENERMKLELREKQNLIRSLSEELNQCKNSLQAKETIHRLQIDTIVRSLAKRSNVLPRTNGKILVPTLDLSKTSSRMGSSEFLEACLKKMDSDSKGKENETNQG